MTYNGGRSRQRPLFYALVLLAGYLSYLILGPFLAALAWAVMFAILFHGMQVALSKRLGPNRAALVTTVLAGILVVAPAVMLVSALAHEAPQVSGYLQDAARSAPLTTDRMTASGRVQEPSNRSEGATMAREVWVILMSTGNGSEAPMLSNVLSRYWWMTLLRGVAWILFGIAMFAQPAISLVTLTLLFGFFALVDGVSNVASALGGRRVDNWWVLLLWGLAGILVGVLTFLSPGVTALGLLYYIAIWAIATGILGIVTAVRLRKEIEANSGSVWVDSPQSRSACCSWHAQVQEPLRCCG